MKQFSCRRLGAGAILTLTLAGATVATAAVPAAASAKGVTRSQVISLIRQYSKPGPAGTSFTIAPNSGLQLSGSALAVNSNLLGGCPSGEVLSSLSVTRPFATGCTYGVDPVIGEANGAGQSGYAAGNDDIPMLPFAAGDQMTTLAQVSLASATTATPAPAFYVNASISLQTGTPGSIDACWLIDLSDGAIFRTQAITSEDFSDFEMEAIVTPAADTDTLAVQCKSGNPDHGMATIVAFPVS